MYIGPCALFGCFCTVLLQIFEGARKGLGGAKPLFAFPQIGLWPNKLTVLYIRQSCIL